MTDAPSSPIIDTHTIEWDPPHTLSRGARWTCTVCGKAVLDYDGNVYGGATTNPCTTPAETPRSPRERTTRLAAEHLAQFNQAFGGPRGNTAPWNTNHADTAF